MFHAYVVSVLSRCCICLQWFQVFFGVYKYFRRMFLSVSSVLRHMLQVLDLNVSKVDRVLHLPSRLLLPRLDVLSASSEIWHGRLGPSPSRCSRWA
jgi:hypothetical protein